MDVEDFLRDDVSIETYSRESYPINDLCWESLEKLRLTLSLHFFASVICCTTNSYRLRSLLRVILAFAHFPSTDETPDGEECDDGIDDESEVREGDSCDHRIWMDDDVGTLKCRIDITGTSSDDSCDWMKEMVGSVAEIRSIG